MAKKNKIQKKIKKIKKNNKKAHSLDDIFHDIAFKTSTLIGNVWVFILACLLTAFSLIVGAFLNFSDVWQLVVNLSVSIITLLIVFIIQNSQNRDTKGIHLKLDELILSHSSARNTIINLDKMSEKGIKELEKHYKKISSQKDDPLEKNDDEK